MNWDYHAIIGFVAAALVLYFLIGVSDLLPLAVLSCFGMLSALVPDIDHKESKGKTFLDVGVVGVVSASVFLSGCGGEVCLPSVSSFLTMLIISLAVFGIYSLVFAFLKPRHRGIIHSLAACTVYTVLILVFLGKGFAVAGLVGYVSHLAADGHVKLA